MARKYNTTQSISRDLYSTPEFLRNKVLVEGKYVEASEATVHKYTPRQYVEMALALHDTIDLSAATSHDLDMLAATYCGLFAERM